MAIIGFRAEAEKTLAKLARISAWHFRRERFKIETAQPPLHGST
jgi:hypothetical protein